MKSLKESPLYQKLLDNTDMVQEILEAHNICTAVGPLGTDIAGMVYYSRRGRYYIVGNQILGFNDQKFVFLHELYHIVAEMPKKPYLVRLDWTRDELVADRVAEEEASKCFY